MSPSPLGKSLTLAVHPSTRGFGWIAFESPLAPYDWALVETPKNKNATCLRKVEELFERLQPEMLVLETFERRNSLRADRITRLCRGLVGLAVERGVEISLYERSDIESCFHTVGARTRMEVAEAVARTLPALRSRLPARRAPWKAEDRRMALFGAAAVALTHYHLGAGSLFEDLGRS